MKFEKHKLSEAQLCRANQKSALEVRARIFSSNLGNPGWLKEF
ncbi:MAG: hypothetical protein AABX75_02520 [Nanoarchaeota archaeon]